MGKAVEPITLNDILQASAERLKAIWPGRKVYVDEVHQNADGAFQVSLTDTEQRQELDRRHRRTVGVQIRYFRADRDTLAYLDWAEAMYDNFRVLSSAGRSVRLRNRTARNDQDGRFYQFLFDVDQIFVEAAPASDSMETLKIEEAVQ